MSTQTQVAPAYFADPLPNGHVYGQLKYDKRYQKWVIEGEPAVIEMAKRLFPGSETRNRTAGRVRFTANKRVIGDINWLMLRFPLEIKEAHLELWQQQRDQALRWTMKRREIEHDIAPVVPPATFNGELRPFQQEGLSWLLHNERTLLADEMGLGKLLPDSEPVLTPDGWRANGSICAGDSVIGQDGRATKVMGVFPQGVQPIVKVTFSDGTWVRCSWDHLWQVQHARNDGPHRYPETNGRWRLMTTREIMDAGLVDGAGNRNWRIPMVRPVEFEEKQLPVDPYLLGVLLGDGGLSHSAIRITTDATIVGALALKGRHFDHRSEGITEFRVSDSDGTLKKALRSIGVHGNRSWEKHVPDEYLLASVDQRLSLLQGLMDTDGYAMPDGGAEFCSTSPSLIHAVIELVQSLGGIARGRRPAQARYRYLGEEKQGRPAERVNLKLPAPINPFRLHRKSSAYVVPTKYQPTRLITSIQPDGEESARCIKVAADDGLYVTRSHIVTHNTPQALAWLAHLDAWPCLVVVMPHLVRQWVSETKKFLRLQTPGQISLLDEAPDQMIHVIKGLRPYELPQASVYFIHYLLLRGWKEHLPDFGFKSVVFDEIQELRHRGTEKYSAASLVAGSVPYVGGLSGTPIYNTGGEIWNVMNIVEYHCLGDWDSFTREWCYGYGSDEVKKPELLGEHLRREGLLLRRTKDQVLDELPPKRRYVQEIDVDNGLYGSLIGDAVKLAVQAKEAEKAFDRGRLEREAINETRRVTGIAKAQAVTTFVRALLDAGEQVILYAYHHDVWDIYLAEFADLKPAVITGKQNPNEKTVAQERFMNGVTDLIMVSLRAAAGLNLQRGKVVVFGELDWSPAIHAQAEDRAHRMGQKDSVLCYYLVCDEGTDQDMLDALGLKVQQFIGIMGDRKETEEDRMLAESKAKEHMARVADRLRQRAEKGHKVS